MAQFRLSITHKIFKDEFTGHQLLVRRLNSPYVSHRAAPEIKLLIVDNSGYLAAFVGKNYKLSCLESK